MYQLLGDQVVDVEDLIALFTEKGIEVTDNLTKATKREDAVGLRIRAGLSQLGITDQPRDEEEMDHAMKAIEDRYKEKIGAFLDKNFAFVLYAYGYDEVTNSILLNFTMMDQGIGRRKLPDVAKRLFDV